MINKSANNSTSEARENMSTDFESLKSYNYLKVCLTKLAKNRILLCKFSQISSDNQAIHWLKQPRSVHCLGSSANQTADTHFALLKL